MGRAGGGWVEEHPQHSRDLNNVDTKFLNEEVQD